MKKLKLLPLLFFMCALPYSNTAQVLWTSTLNTIPSGSNGNIGTNNNRSFNIYTNNQLRFKVDSLGNLTFAGLAGGINDHLLVVQPNGRLGLAAAGAFTTNTNNFLRQDGTWAPMPGAAGAFTLNGQNLITAPGIKLGIGTAAPVNELEVVGNTEASGSSIVGDKMFLGPPQDYAIMKYIPATANYPAVFTIGGGGANNPANPSPGNPYNPSPGHGNGEHSPDPLPDMACIVGESNPNALPPSATILNNVLCVKKVIQQSPIAAAMAGNINIGHNGFNAFIETQGGTLNQGPHEGDLFINSKCNRSVYVFSNSNSFAPGLSSIMSIDGKLNVSSQVQIGNSGATAFQPANTQLYLYSPPTTPIGMKVRHGGGGESAIKVIELSDNDRGLAVYRGTPTADGNERFSVLGDGKTSIFTSNADALVVADANSPAQINFRVLKDGASRISTSNSDALTIADALNANQVNFKLSNNGSAQFLNMPGLNKAVVIKNTSLNEVFSVSGNGYTEIGVYSPSGMPKPYNSTYARALTIRDLTNNRDIFVVRSDGVAYAREVEISLSATFPDYVFDACYELKPLSEVSAYIQNNKHLPGFESAAFYEKNGLNVNTLLIKQQEKIEELTLYLIALEKRLSELEVKH
ncbi:MAG: hypothetical protein JNK73_06855 [Bacteroidia bacterium]|nr:hypothetical protein [Bacteroidia bacterium]